jgi:uncharacterized protein YecE (DUF72 family)
MVNATTRVWIGTSGFQYPEWKGAFYPQDLPASKMLAYYAERFRTTEINYSFHRIPSAKTIHGWAAATPDQFKFSLKAPQKITHFAKLRDCGDTLNFFHKAIALLGEKLGIVLFQLPPNFKKDAALLESFLRDLPFGMRAAMEFRHTSWFDDDVFSQLKTCNVALCIAESDTLSAPQIATADFGYLRLRRGDYQSSDVARWTHFVRQQPDWQEAFIYFKHEESGTGPKFAREMMSLLGT